MKWKRKFIILPHKTTSDTWFALRYVWCRRVNELTDRLEYCFDIPESKIEHQPNVGDIKYDDENNTMVLFDGNKWKTMINGDVMLALYKWNVDINATSSAVDGADQ